jgi:uncharacterized protein
VARSERNLLSRLLLALAQLLRHPGANLSECEPAPTNSVRYLSGCKYLLLETIKRDGTQVATPMCFASVADVIFLRTGVASAKLARVCRQPIVRVAPCRLRGAPTGEYIQCIARILPDEQEARAEQSLQRAHGLRRRLLDRLARNRYAYLELTPITGDPLPEYTALALGIHAVRQLRRETNDSPKGAA